MLLGKVTVRVSMHWQALTSIEQLDEQHSVDTEVLNVSRTQPRERIAFDSAGQQLTVSQTGHSCGSVTAHACCRPYPVFWSVGRGWMFVSKARNASSALIEPGGGLVGRKQ